MNSARKSPKPVVKWAGGKRQLLDEIKSLAPKEYNTYFEPFVGGGAVLFCLQPQNAVINDLNSELVCMYKVIKNNPLGLIDELRELSNNVDVFNYIRSLDRNHDEFKKLSDLKKAARLIYLNKTCYNGLYRVNANGEFNTPFAYNKNPLICDANNIISVHDYFVRVDIDIKNTDFEKSVTNAQTGDFVYFDPPYDPISLSAAFTSYSKEGFDKNAQKRLAKLCIDLTDRGVKVMVSNSNTEFVRELYSAKCFKIHIVEAGRAINSKAEGRGKIEEVIITNYEV